ncbi:MAG: nuclear transport factor 2 family protein [Actinomycetota bacterium]
MSPDPIAALVHHYADAVVHRDVEQWRGTWTEDGIWDLGRANRVEGRDAIVAAWQAAMDGFDAVIQIVFNGTHHLDDGAGTGSGRWYIQESLRPIGGDPTLLVAHYNDTYRLDDGQWRFAQRALVVHYAGPPDLSGPFLNARG